MKKLIVLLLVSLVLVACGKKDEEEVTQVINQDEVEEMEKQKKEEQKEIEAEESVSDKNDEEVKKNKAENRVSEESTDGTELSNDKSTSKSKKEEKNTANKIAAPSKEKSSTETKVSSSKQTQKSPSGDAKSNTKVTYKESSNKEKTEKSTNPPKKSNNTTPPKNNKPVSKPKDTTKPVLSGVGNTSIEYGGSFNILKGVTAKDNIDGDITSKIVTSGSVNAEKDGTYTITYSVSDKAGNKATAKRNVTVKAKPAPAKPKDDVVNFLKYPSKSTSINLVGDLDRRVNGIRASEKTYNGALNKELAIGLLLLGEGNITPQQFKNELNNKVTDNGKYRITNVVINTTSLHWDELVDETHLYNYSKNAGLFSPALSGVKYDVMRVVVDGNKNVKVYRVGVQFTAL